VAVELIDPRCALEVVPRDLRLPCRDRWLVLVAVGVILVEDVAQDRLLSKNHLKLGARKGLWGHGLLDLAPFALKRHVLVHTW